MRESISPALADGEPGSELLRALGRPELAGLFAAARERRERLGRVGGTLVLAHAGRAERTAVADLLGLPTVPKNPLRVELARLDQALRSSRFAVGLEDTLVALGGPLRDRPAERAAALRSWESLFERTRRHPLLAASPALGRWLDDLKADGTLRRSAGAASPETLLQRAIDVLVALPNPGEAPIRLTVLASRALGSSHGLDCGSATSTLVLRALSILAERPMPRDREGRRWVWERFNVVDDDVSSHVLVLNLPPATGGATAEALAALTRAGEPARLTLRQLGEDLAFAPPRTVRICENPTVLAAAADRLGPSAASLICLEGQPSLAARRLLSRLDSAGFPLAYHGDFDWPGLTIANGVLGEFDCRPWQFTAADYLRAVGELSPERRLPLSGPPVVACWDDELSSQMSAMGVAIEEELVLDRLLAALARPGDP